MTAAKVLTIGREPDPAKRLRAAWGSAIREHRQLRGMTIDALADAMGNVVTAAAIGMWERGETAPRWHHQVAVARALDVAHRSLFAITDEVA